MLYTKEKTQAWLEMIANKTKDHPSWAKVFEKCFTNTLDETMTKLDDGTTFILTGDIPAMWLRDSAAQVRPYLALAKEDLLLRQTILGLIERQLTFICHDPYANSFNMSENWNGHHETDKTHLTGWIWERKYEVDSLCYPLQLAYLLWQKTGESSQFNTTFFKALKTIVELWTVEQNHDNSPYRFERETNRQEDTLVNDGCGPACAYTGMTWSAFRPSDDACQYSYLVPSNMFAVVVLDYALEIIDSLFNDTYKDLAQNILTLKEAIDSGIKAYGVTQNQKGEKVFAYEVDGLGNASIMDDPNVPSLLAAPYLGYCQIDDPIYQATRRTILSPENPYYYQGEYAKGLGSSHTFYRYIWPIALQFKV